MLVRVRARPRARVRVSAPVVQLEAKGLRRVVDDGGLGEVRVRVRLRGSVKGSG